MSTMVNNSKNAEMTRRVEATFSALDSYEQIGSPRKIKRSIRERLEREDAQARLGSGAIAVVTITKQT